MKRMQRGVRPRRCLQSHETDDDPRAPYAGANPDTGEMESVPVGDGVIDWQGQLQALIDDGYEGHLCLETHWRPSLKIDDAILNRPGGQAFSEAGEEASRICIEKLMAMIENLKQ